MTLDNFVAECWHVCDDGWFFSFRSDQWWEFRADCPHGNFKVVSQGDRGLAACLSQLYAQVCRINHGV